MKLDLLRQKYPKFIYESYSLETKGQQLVLQFHYSAPPDLHFTHTTTFENINLSGQPVPPELVFHIGLAEMPSYWKSTCSPTIEVQAGPLSSEQINWWHKLFLKGMGEYFYKNQIDFTSPDFLTITSTGTNSKPLSSYNPHKSVLIPLGGGKDSIVTLEIIRKHFPVQPFVAFPASPATINISKQSGFDLPVSAHRNLDPRMINLDKNQFLSGHVPYSAALAFISLIPAFTNKHTYIAVSNERSSNEGNTTYLGHTINHQYSKTLEFETDFNNYLHDYLTPSITYFSFLRPLYELQISKLFSKLPKYFSTFRSCNRGQQKGIWCGKCPKCVSTALTLLPWTNLETITKIFGHNPLTDPANSEIISQMTDASKIKPFECVTTIEEANIAQDLIHFGPNPKSDQFMSSWEANPNLPPEFESILKDAYSNS